MFIVAVALSLAVGVGTSYCAAQPAQEYFVTLDYGACRKVQNEVLKDFNLHIYAGVVRCTISGLKKETYRMILVGALPNGDVMMVGLEFKRGVVVAVKLKHTDKRCLRA